MLIRQTPWLPIAAVGLILAGGATGWLVYETAEPATRDIDTACALFLGFWMLYVADVFKR